eukprot:gene12372-16595_t
MSCGNPDCDQTGNLKCAACQGVMYCSATCQKKHWSQHKVICKASSKANKSSKSNEITATSTSSVELINNINNMKSQTQKSFNSGNFQEAIEYGLQALELSKSLAPVQSVAECIQIHINLASSYLQIKSLVEAESHCSASIELSEKGFSVRTGERPNPQAVEILSISLGTKAIILLNMSIEANGNTVDRVGEANTCAMRSLTLAESIYPKNDPRLFKSLRTLALVRDREKNFSDAEKLFFRAYTILCLGNGVESGETQALFEEMTQMLVRKGDESTAIKHATNNYKSLNDKLGEKSDDTMTVADAAA